MATILKWIALLAFVCVVIYGVLSIANKIDDYMWKHNTSSEVYP